MVGAAAASSAPADETPTSPVGISARIEQLILPGTELEAIPLADRRLPIVLRVVAAYPHGTAFRYDLEYYGLDPGEYDLRDYLRRKDGSSIADLPPVPVAIASSLPPGQIRPHDLAAEDVPFSSHYRYLVAGAGVLWIAGLMAILLVGRRRKGNRHEESAGPVSLADRLRPLVEDAVAGRLDPRRRAELERMLLTWWRDRLDLHDMTAAQAITHLRNHAQAGELLRQLELWLHAPARPDTVDVAALLEPYRTIPANANGREMADAARSTPH